MHGSLHNLAELAEYFQLKKYVQDSERVQMYLSATSEALSIITGLSSFHFYTRMGYPNHSFNALQDFMSYFWQQKKSYPNSLRRRHALSLWSRKWHSYRPRGLGQGILVLHSQCHFIQTSRIIRDGVSSHSTKACCYSD